MSLEEAKNIYIALKDSGDLKIMYRSMTGDWAKDKSKFLSQYTTNEAFINKYKASESNTKTPK
jgi:hypothetical protein